MTFPNFDPAVFHIGAFALRWYALAYVAGILLGWRYAVALVRNPRIWGSRLPTLTSTQIDDLVLWITLGIIVGGRLGSILFYSTSTIWEHPLEILQIWHGGMSFHGGLIGVTIALVVFSRVNRINLLRLADLTAPCVPIGLFFGRIANFINGELWGRVTDVPWAISFCNKRLAQQNGGECAAGTAPRHPSQLYEAGLEGIVLFLLLRWATHNRHWLQRNGVVTGLFLLAYGLFRVSLENVRNPDIGMPNFPLGLTMGMILSIPMILAGAFLMWRGLAGPLPEPDLGEALPEPTPEELPAQP